MSLKFAANLNFLFLEGASSLAERVNLAHRSGFRAIELPYPTAGKEEVIKAKMDTGIEIALTNICTDGPDAAKFGCASIPGLEDIFKTNLLKTITFAKAVNCKKIHIMAGLMNPTANFNEHLKVYTANLQYAAAQLEEANIVGLIEPINKYALPSYFLSSYDTASDVLRQVKSKHLKMMLDIFHCQHIMGNLCNTFKEYADCIGHVQIAQVPHRHEPHVPGELDFGYIFEFLSNTVGYNDWIGCEYKPKGNTEDGLQWLAKYGLEL